MDQVKFGGFGKSGKAKEVSGPLELTIISYFCNLRFNIHNIVSKVDTNYDEFIVRMTPGRLPILYVTLTCLFVNYICTGFGANTVRSNTNTDTNTNTCLFVSLICSGFGFSINVRARRTKKSNAAVRTITMLAYLEITLTN